MTRSERSWPWRSRGARTSTLPDGAVVGTAKLDRRTKNLIPRLSEGDIAVIDHVDLDRVAAEGLVDAGVAAVVNASSSMTGRYPNMGPLVVLDAGLQLVDEVGADVLDLIAEGTEVAIDGGDIYVDGEVVASGVDQNRSDLLERIEIAKSSLGDELGRFAENTLEYLTEERTLVADDLEIPDVGLDFRGRHVLIAVRGTGYQDDLEALRRIGYVNELRPIIIGVDGGADALLEMGFTPDLILGDFDSVSKDALRCGARLVVHGYEGGEAPGARRLDRLGFDYIVWEAPGTSEDIAMLMAYEHEAALIVAVGTHSSMAEFLDKGRAGMASTFLVRMRVGSILVDAKGVSRLYQSQVRKRDLILLVLSALFTIVVIGVVSEPIRLVLRTLWTSL